MAESDSDSISSTEADGEESTEEALFAAIVRNNLEAATGLIASGANVNHTNKMSKTAMYLALENENTSMVQMLIKAGADLNMPSYCHTYCTYEKPIVTTARLQRLDLVELLLDHGAQLEGRPGTCAEGKTALQWAATYGDLHMAQVLYNRGSDVNWIGQYFHTALHYATIAEKPHMVQWLLERGAQVAINGDGRSPLHIAAVRGSLKIVQHLLKSKCEVDLRDNFSFTPFSLACLRGHLSIIHCLIEMSREGTHFDLDDGLHKASESGHVNTMRYLIDNGANVNALNNLGESPLSVASRGQHLAVLMLLEKGSKLNTVDKRGYMPLQLALLREQVDISRSLIQHGAKLNIKVQHTESPLQIAYASSNPMLIKYIIQAGCRLKRESWFTHAQAHERLKELDFQCPWPHEGQIKKDIWEWIISSLGQPKSLISLSRIAIREHLMRVTQGRSILGNIQKLPLPLITIKYLQLDDILWE